MMWWNKVSKLVQRLLIFFIGLPLVIGMVAVSASHHLLLHVVIILCSLFSSSEVYGLFEKKYKQFPKLYVYFLTGIPALVACLCALLGFSFHYLEFSLLICFLLILATEVLTAKTFTYSIEHILTSTFIVLYAGYLITYVSRLTVYKNSTVLIMTYLFMIFLCDSLAWLIGMLFGKNNRGIFKASPNKSLAGFFGGYAGSIASALLAKYIWPEVFFGSVVKMIFMGILIATTGMLGDLVESVIKRCVGVKDSGCIIPGRGGLLDSIDSIIFAGPVFYMIIFLFFREI